ncbi:hypothetical protein M413DRAFT_27599 [Hebeloma cylindrosporum]|uniref:NACHT domain-containing protein n=1 Tax=Hebeloma cylindrosporum TaxID=76867 RepID=A0A0C3BXB4_HEBCY|nr:hypothetical protein M413DRAFT_27599 [Hebeloma cylindrosporum h7]
MNRLRSWAKSINPYATRSHTIRDFVPLQDGAERDAEHEGLTAQFAQRLLKKLLECVDGNQVKRAFSMARAIIEMDHELGDNKNELQVPQCVKDMANRLLAVERMLDIGIPSIAKQEKEKFELILRNEINKLEDLALRRLVIQMPERERILEIFQCVYNATMAFQFGVANSMQERAKMRHEAELKSLHPSEKVDPKNEECMGGTCGKIINTITEWAVESSSDSPRVFCLAGQAGSGKTTIVNSIAKCFETGGNTGRVTVLGGKFLCSRKFEETQQADRIIPTIAYQLAHKCQSYADALVVTGRLFDDGHDVATQLRKLLIGPWQLSEPTRRPERPFLVIIDALDELKGDGGLPFLRGLLAGIDEYDLRGLKFLVTSRSDELCESFASDPFFYRQELPIEEAKQDVELYLKARLKELNGRPELDELVKRAGGLFLYAATAVRYLTPPFNGSSALEEQIEKLVYLVSKSHEASTSNATLLIDSLYQHIMWYAFSGSKRKRNGSALTRRFCLYTLLCTAAPTSVTVAAALVPGGDDEAGMSVLSDLHAVLYTQDDQVFWYHASFRDFIFTQGRSNFRVDEENFAFSCNEPSHHKLLSESCFRVMKSGLRFNIGNIASSFESHSRHQTLAEQVDHNIDTTLRYSSCYWAHHLASAALNDTSDLCCSISEFLQLRVLFWIEAMNLLGLRDQCAPMLQRAREWVLKCGNSYSQLSDDLDEAAKFATFFAERLGHTGSVTSVTYSPDGTQILSGCDDQSMCLWDAGKGTQIRSFEGHTDAVNSVGFSTDGIGRIVSASTDGTVRVWDISNGIQLQEFETYYSEILSVSFSSDGTRIACPSDGKLVCIWNATTGARLHELEGHTGTINSVAFSPDGTRIGSGSDDKSVRVWNVYTGEQMRVLIGHTLEVTSVAFSTTGRIASGSRDNSLRVWDASTGVLLHVINAHLDWVTSIAFSSDGARIVSGSRDLSVRVWDMSMGLQVQQFVGHEGPITSVSFSCDGEHVVSGADDGAIRVWRIPALLPNQPSWQRAHADWIISSPGGKSLMWFPHKGHLETTFNTLLITARPVFRLDFDQSMLGDKWVRCYTP